MVGLLAIGTSAFGQEIAFKPIRTSALGSPAGTIGTPVNAVFETVTLPTGGTVDCWNYAIDAGGVEVDIAIEAQGWSLATGTIPCTQNSDCLGGAGGAEGSGICEGNGFCQSTLAAIQATVVSAGYNNGVGATLNPKGWPGNPGNGAYLTQNVCADNSDPCDPPFSTNCGGRPTFCVPNQFAADGVPDFVMPPCTGTLPGIATPSLDYGWAAAAQTDCNVDDATINTLGGLILDVPAGAKGTYVIALDPDPNNSFMTAGTGIPVPGVVFTPACITVTTGSCCSAIGPNVVCEDGLTTAECDLRPGPRLFRPGVACDPLQPGGCPICEFLSQLGCDDGDACTDDRCNVDGTCSHTLNYDPATQCCDPDSGATTTISDNDVCTDDICNADGSVDHPFNTADCNDGNNCTENDVCDGNGTCAGNDINLVACPNGDSDCSAGFCNTTTGFCECTLDTPLTCTISGSAAPDPNCFGEGETVQVQIGIGPGSEQVGGGQFLLNYPTNCLDFVGLDACPGTIFDSIIEWEVDEAAGTIWYAATSDPAAPEYTNASEPFICIEFTYAGGCTCDGNICFDSVNPRNTILTNEMGNRIPTTEECCKDLRGRGEIDLQVPDDAQVNADCGLPSAVITWDAPSATDTCDGDLDVVCVAAHDGGLPIDHLIAGGGEFPQGTSFFRCDASNSCGDTAGKVWTVDVSDQHGLDVEVHLSPTIAGDVFSRGITFGLYLDCVSDPIETCEILDFGGPYNFHAHARANLKVDKGNYMCITAQDLLHTLRAAADVVCVDNAWTAVFKGDPLQGGNWLIGGNLDAWKANGNGNTIDVLDAGMYLSVIAGNQGSTTPGANTDCGPYMEAHADINADGVVDSADYSFILENFLAASKDACCPAATVDSSYIPQLSVSVKELRERGLGMLSVADLNRDGFIDTTDMDLYQQGVQPTLQRSFRKVGR